MHTRLLPTIVCGIVSLLLFAACGGSTPPDATATAPAMTFAPEAGATRTNPKDGAVYVYVPAGPFIMGSFSDEDRWAPYNEKPQMSDFSVDGFWIMQTEVTNAQYAKCVAAGACQEPDNDRWDAPSYAEHPDWNQTSYTEHPVTDVDWHQASTYAQWAGGRLPSEAEWEKACRGIDGQIWPWGDEISAHGYANNADVGDTTPVGKYPQGASPYGALDMAGNVWEWTTTKWTEDYQNYQPDDGSAGNEPRMFRGGSWFYDVFSVRCAARFGRDPDFRGNDHGFRVVSSGE